MGNHFSSWRPCHSSGGAGNSETHCPDPAPHQAIVLDTTSSNLYSMSIGFDEEPESNASRAISIGRSSLPGVRAMGAAIAVPKSGIVLELISNSQFVLRFGYTSRVPVTVTFLFRQLHQGLNNGIPIFSSPELKLGPFELPVGDKLTYRLDPAEVSRHKKLTLSYCSFQRTHKFVPILLLFESKNADYVLYIMGGLTNTEVHNEWSFVVTKQRVRQGKIGYELQEVYGLNASALSRPGDSTDDSDNQQCRCVVCLTNMKDTIIMPCRHMCLCHECASAMAHNHQFCPICRRQISHICQISQAGGP
ncbi:putative E3 ubiquitin-protein ligase MGRN1 [Babesia sp. Xinjiang]|uniref:putative E3 ubiquitin-protein ligase MGRN1 n=1 Tax=Babesia sp. Xinjiang TaxID=462227 RepID=UPI000A216E8E|nr:putative E3 ubiquitin-protein ligase MGRN1 [Babesia sp. Xinjiang]ORM39399.1 putative E3 ubiquitin-protein ligase MGRN1 [Babesia sp. Xinjiang]